MKCFLFSIFAFFIKKGLSPIFFESVRSSELVIRQAVVNTIFFESRVSQFE